MPNRILVVDDEASIQHLLRDYLQRKGFEVTCAADGEEALTLIETEPPDLTVIDFLLPKKNGFALAEAIRSHKTYGDMPLIMMSGVAIVPRGVEQHKVPWCARTVDRGQILFQPLVLCRRRVVRTVYGATQNQCQPSLCVLMSCLT